MPESNPISALIGGGVIGLAAALFLLAHGRVCGVSGLFGGLLRRDADVPAIRFAFVGGLLAGGVVLRIVAPSWFDGGWAPSLGLAATAGLLVRFGTQLGNGCTSGHGICGLARLSIRSLVATGVFMAAGFATVFVSRHLVGGGS